MRRHQHRHGEVEGSGESAMSAAGAPRIRHRFDAYVSLDLLAFMDRLFQVAVTELVGEQLTALS